MSETETQAPEFTVPEAVHYTASDGRVYVALVLEPQVDSMPAKLRVLRNGRTSLRVAVLDAESGTYKREIPPAPALPTVVAYADRNGNVRPALVQIPETEAAPATVLVLRNSGTTYSRQARANEAGQFVKVETFWSGYADENDSDSDDEFGDEGADL